MSSSFDKFLRQQRADADEKVNVGRADPRTPNDRAVEFIDALQSQVEGRETEISTMKVGLRVFEWNRRQRERIWFRASQHEMAAEADADGKVHVVGKRYVQLEGGRASHQLADAPELNSVIDVSNLGHSAIREQAGALLIDFLKTAYA